jgi:hypothetical protein
MPQREVELPLFDLALGEMEVGLVDERALREGGRQHHQPRRRLGRLAEAAVDVRQGQERLVGLRPVGLRRQRRLQGRDRLGELPLIGAGAADDVLGLGPQRLVLEARQLGRQVRRRLLGLVLHRQGQAATDLGLLGVRRLGELLHQGEIAGRRLGPAPALQVRLGGHEQRLGQELVRRELRGEGVGEGPRLLEQADVQRRQRRLVLRRRARGSSGNCRAKSA